MSLSNKPLHIISASAGSGKTYVLVKEYLKLLLNDHSLSNDFRSILAMTFTNKAALEMKERILKALDEISSPVQSSPTSEHLLKDLIRETPVTEDKIRIKFRQILSEILHQYEDFGVMTMDKFNLKLIKAFSRDLDLPVDFEISFNNDEVLGSVVDELMSKLGNKEYAELNGLILRYARTKLEDGEKWNVRDALLKFIKILEAERNKEGLEHLMQMEFTIPAYVELNKKLRDIEKTFIELCTEIRPTLQDVNPSDLPGGNTTFNTISRLSEGPRFPLKELFTEPFRRKLNREEKKVFPERLEGSLLRLQAYWESELYTFNTLYEYRKNYFNMALLKYVYEELILFRKNEKIVRISEFNELVASLIQQEDAPFIYERLGSRYRNYLLDEFQDTSFLQWNNLVPLVHNSLSNGDLNLIVGDSKQSIYRFKNGVAEQFVKLPALYNPKNDPRTELRSRFFQQMGDKTRLDKNFRSSPTIVNFNNQFFQIVRDGLSDSGKEFYSDLEQHPTSTLDGSIAIVSEQTLFDHEELMDQLTEQIEECISKGFKHSDICILGVKNKECNQWAIDLTERGYQVVSSDSLLINNDPVVKLLIAYLELRHSPNGKTAQRQFAASYFTVRSGLVNNYSDYLIDTNGQLIFDFERFVSDHFPDKPDSVKFFCSYETLYDLLQKFLRLIGEDELNNSYAHHLADVVFDFESIHGPDIGAFLEFYEKHKGEFAVQVPESESALTIMTIHKSKGLEFPVVIIPAISVKTDSSKEFLINREDIVIYKKPGSDEVLPEIAQIYELEKDQTMIDNVNMLYVAMTRPKERLVILNYFEKGAAFNTFFHSCLKQMDGVSETGDRILFETGFQERLKMQSSATYDHYTPRKVNDLLWFPNIALKDNEDLDAVGISEKQQFGNQFHELIASADSEQDLERTADTLLLNGRIGVENRNKLIEAAKEIFGAPQYVSLHQNVQSVLKEQAILLTDGSVLRADRILIYEDKAVVLDFKTGERNPSKDNKQVSSYIQTLKAMGYRNLSGILIYTEDCSFVTVDS